MTRAKVVAGNWKMNKTVSEANQLVNEIISLLSADKNPKAKTILCTPFVYLSSVRDSVAKTSIAVGAQNCSEHESGAYTGEVLASMLASLNIPYVIIGHSERRQYFNESNKVLADKVNLALKNKLTPIFCCGEPLAIRESNTHLEFVKNQLTESLFHLSAEQAKQLIIAYEPIWAIGTGKTASNEQAQEMHHIIRQHVASKWGNDIANAISILYGGSVKASNAKELFACVDVDGGLVGGASLQAKEFVDIIRAAN